MQVPNYRALGWIQTDLVANGVFGGKPKLTGYPDISTSGYPDIRFKKSEFAWIQTDLVYLELLTASGSRSV